MAASRTQEVEVTMPYEVPPLPYPFDALEPHIDAQTMEIHHDKHHQAYVTNLNKALEGHPDLQSKPIEDLIGEHRRGAGRDPHGRAQQRRRPRQPLAVLEDHGPERRRRADRRAGQGDQRGRSAASTSSRSSSPRPASTRFGSGWAWLIVGQGRQARASLEHAEPGQPAHGRAQTPILGIDVWEHAYYLKYQNRRPDYIAAWWNTVNWPEVARRYEQAAGGRG